jgi:hypothetical protein
MGKEQKRERETTIIMYIKKEKYYPLFAGVTYLAVDDLSIDNEEVSMIESSYCSPSSLCFSTKKIRKLFFCYKSNEIIYDLHHNMLL